jgi:hypothetical protein
MLHSSGFAQTSPKPLWVYATRAVFGVPTALKRLRTEPASATFSRVAAKGTDPDFCNWPVERLCDLPLAEEFDAVHLSFEPDAAVITAPLSTKRARDDWISEAHCYRALVPPVAGFHSRAVLRGDMTVSAPLAAMAS